MSTLVRSRRRLSWLSVNILLNIAAASVIALYQDTLAQVIALAVFLPIISDMSGCSGNHAVAVSMRELSLGVVKPFEVLHVAAKEGTVGVLNGLVLGVLISLAGLLYTGTLPRRRGRSGSRDEHAGCGADRRHRAASAAQPGHGSGTCVRANPHHRHRCVRFLPDPEPGFADARASGSLSV